MPRLLRFVLLLASTLLLLAQAAVIAGLAQEAPAPPVYPVRGHSITVPFASAVDFTNLSALKLLTQINGGPAHAFTIDTGSVGVIVPAEDIPGFDPHAPGNTPGTLRYASSGLTLTGFWTVAFVSFLQPDPRRIVTLAGASVHVLAVTASSCQGGGANAGRCTGEIPHQLGVGFGRGGDAANGMRTQADNPFVNLNPMRTGGMAHGYQITRAGVIFGLAAPQTRGYSFSKLTPTASAQGPQAPPEHTVVRYGPIVSNTGSEGDRAGLVFTRDYNTAPGFLTLGTHAFPLGTVLIDTGLTNMIVEESGEPSSGSLPAGKAATVHLLGDLLRYSFTTGDATGPASPTRASWATFSHGPFVNTGLHVLACFDYLYDADNGYLGLRPTCAAR